MNMKRMRGRNHRSGNGPQHSGGNGGGGGQIRQQGGNIPLNRNHVFDSSGPDLRIRGTAQQLFEKYLQLGRDATSGGDRVMAESYFQHAEHYFRILNAMAQATQQGQPNTQGQQQRPRHENNGPESMNQDEGEESDNGNPAHSNAHQQHSNNHHQQAQPAGMGDQPGSDSREIPISSGTPDA